MAETRVGERGKAIAPGNPQVPKKLHQHGKTAPLGAVASQGFNLQVASRAANGLKAVTAARPGRWGNPFVVGCDGTQSDCVARYCAWLALPGQAELPRATRPTLCGSNFACWCASGAPCHGDILLALVNSAL